jgi:hypothetical protein
MRTPPTSRYLARADDEAVIIKLTHDEALVLSDWLCRVEQSDELSALVTDQAAWSPLRTISATLEVTLVEPFMPDCNARVEQARQRLLATGEQTTAGE